MTDAVRSLVAPLAGDVALYRAPGRVNLIGDHTDYNDGLVMPVAIDLYTWVAVQRRDDGWLRVESSNVGESVEIDGRERIEPRGHWSDYVAGVVDALRRRGVQTPGLTIRIHSDLPIGAGLSSSAALEVAAAFAVAEAAGSALEPMALAQLCRSSENNFVGARVGLMDPFIAAHGIAGHAMLLDCRSLAFRRVVLPRGTTIVVCNSMVRHDHATGGYNQRREECDHALRVLQSRDDRIASLRDVSAHDFERIAAVLSPVERRRVRHVVTENERVVRLAGALERGDMATVAGCMRESHESLRDDYEVSAPELNLLVDLASVQPGVHGARMTGGGFGGCTVNLVEDDAVTDFVACVGERYQQRTSVRPDIIRCASADGVRRVDIA